jgi:hypothetical protein
MTLAGILALAEQVLFGAPAQAFEIHCGEFFPTSQV